jgi:hypothetical protein
MRRPNLAILVLSSAMGACGQGAVDDVVDASCPPSDAGSVGPDVTVDVVRPPRPDAGVIVVDGGGTDCFQDAGDDIDACRRIDGVVDTWGACGKTCCNGLSCLGQCVSVRGGPPECQCFGIEAGCDPDLFCCAKFEACTSRGPSACGKEP